MSVISQREIQIGAKTLIVYIFDYAGAEEAFEVPASIQQVSGLHMDAGIAALSAGLVTPSVAMTDIVADSSLGYTKTVTVGTTAGPVGRVLVCALCAAAPGSIGVSVDNSSGSAVYLVSPK